MKHGRFLILGLIVAAFTASVAEAKGKKSELKTDVRFDDNVLHGQYQVPEEALAKVENEKVLKDIVGIRKHFKDRLLESAEQE